MHDHVNFIYMKIMTRCIYDCVSAHLHGPGVTEPASQCRLPESSLLPCMLPRPSSIDCSTKANRESACVDGNVIQRGARAVASFLDQAMAGLHAPLHSGGSVRHHTPITLSYTSGRSERFRASVSRQTTQRDTVHARRCPKFGVGI